MSASPPDVEGLVRARFSVKEYFALPDGELEFQIAYDQNTKRRFSDFQTEAAAKGYRPELAGSKDDCVLVLRKAEQTPSRQSRVTVLMALLTLASLGVFAYFQLPVDEQLLPSVSAGYVFFGFAGTVAVLLGAHEMGQRLAARNGRAGHSNSYLIPGVPFITSFLPSLGFVNTQREPAVNKDALFDVVIAGPLAILVLAIVLYILGEVTAVPSTVPLNTIPLANSTILINPSAIQMGIGLLLGPLVRSVPAGYVQISPIADGAAFGFVLVFICLLPMAIFDGGLLANVAWGEKAARGTTYLSVLVLLIIDMNVAPYWAVAIVALLLAGRPARLKLRDEVSRLSSSRRWVFVGTLVLAFLCLPIPHSLATLPLP